MRPHEKENFFNPKGGETHKPPPPAERDPSGYNKNIKQQDPPGPQDTNKKQEPNKPPPAKT